MAVQPIPYWQDEKKFLRNLAAGHKAESRVQAILEDMGIVVTAPPRLTRPSVGERAKFSDIDLCASVHIEVKERPNVKFTSAADYPFPTVFVAAVKRYDALTPRPLATILISGITGEAVWIPLWTRRYWSKESTYDSVRGYEYEVYTCPREHLQNIKWLRLLLATRPDA